METIIGREEEKKILRNALPSKDAELIYIGRSNTSLSVEWLIIKK